MEACKRDVRVIVRDKDWKGLMDKYEDFRNDMMDIDAKKMAEEAVELESLKAKLDDCSGRVETIQRGDGRR